ncbi:helix-turn-helix transcriptional regulator [Pseudonocardia sp. DLS-67]
MLLGRRSECERLEQLLETIRVGRSGALVVLGEPGVGKTALLGHMAERASDCRVLRAAGVQSEMELAFAGLHQVCAPLMDRVEALPVPQRDALRTVFGLSGGAAPDRFLVGLGVLSLLADAARERPLVCLIDDAQWLDRVSAQVLAFAARRLVAESVAIVFGAPVPGEPVELAGLPELEVGGLADEDARALLESKLGGPIDERVRDRIIAETAGNPLALLELPRGLTPAALAAGFGPVAGAPLPQQIEESFRRRLAPLDADTRHLLLIAAAEPMGDPALVWRAAEQLGIGVAAAAPAAAADLLQIGTRIRFRHPLVRSAICRAASGEDRRTAHRALARATDPEIDPDRRAWHAAQAACGPDEAIAADLERSAGRAQARGGMAAAAALLERAAHLTPEPVRRAERMIVAAEATHHAGASDAALGILPLVEVGPLDKLQRARADLLRAQIALSTNRGRTAPPLLLEAARQLEPLDARLARETYLDALLAAMFAGSLATTGVREIAEAARLAPAPPDEPGAADLLLDGLAMRFTDGYAAAVPPLRRAMQAFRDPHLSPGALRRLWLARITAGNLWDEETLETAQHVRLAREAGALDTLPLALTVRIGAHTLVGELDRAEAVLDQLDAATEATGNPVPPYGALVLAAWRGRRPEATALIETATGEALRRGEGFGLVLAGWAEAMLANSLGRYEDALAAARKAGEHPPVMGVEPWGALVEHVEAAARSGQLADAADALARLSETTRATGTDWGLGIEARTRAQLLDGRAAEDAYREAIDRLGRTRLRGELARAHLVHGEWLRRERRRLDARDELRTAHEMFGAMGMQAWSRRAAGELAATGETARKRPAETSTELTPQEAQVVRLVREGLSNAEIAGRLFISPRTVEWHVSRIFSKLGISSRRELRR